MQRIQFNVGQLLVITTVVAIIAAIIGRLELPPVLGRVLLWSYLILLGAWLVFRGPAVITGLSDVQRRRRELANRRISLLLEIQAKREARQSQSAADAPHDAPDRLN